MSTRVELLTSECSGYHHCAQHPNKGEKKKQTINQIKQPFPELLGQDEAQAPFISKTSPGDYL